MRSALNTLYTVAGALGALLLTIPVVVHAEAGPEIPHERDELDRWVPFFGIASGAYGQEVEADVTACCNKIFTVPASPPPNVTILDPPQQTTNPLRPPASGNDLMVTPFVGGNIGIESPGWRDLPGSPRFFVRGDASWIYSLEKDPAREGSPDELVDPMRPLFAAVGVAGQGSTTSVRVEPLAISAGAGITFTFEAFDRRFRIKPSVEYMREETRVRGQVLTAQTVRVGRPAQPATPTQPALTSIDSTFRFLEQTGEEKKWFNGVGPGLEVEMDAARAGPFMMTLYLSGQAYHWIGDRTVTIDPGDLQVSYSGPGLAFPPPIGFDPNTVPNNETADWGYKRNRWGYRGGIGIRFRWQPE